MLRTSLIRSTRAVSARAFSTSRITMAAGDVGGTRSGGERSGDAFNKRESAQEEMWIKREEQAKLRALKEKLTAQTKHLEGLSKEIDEMLEGQKPK